MRKMCTFDDLALIFDTDDVPDGEQKISDEDFEELVKILEGNNG